MAPEEDLIDFGIIETEKENIQSLPQGRSAKALISTFSPPTLFSPAPTPGATRNLNDAIRQEYEQELLSISESDDPLDVYNRYVKWTLNAYPSAQATPESQLRPLLERATKAFQSDSIYKNDPRYLKLWLTYVRLFSDAPKETFAYLARHNIGDGLALYYEEFAAWLEGAGRWTQAEEIYKLGIEREARPAERLLRKYSEFQQRLQTRPQTGEEPSSPALPTVRPALVAKLDPFALSTPVPSDPQAQRLPTGIGGSSTSRSGRQKLAVFSDSDPPASANSKIMGDSSKGWDNIGSIQDRKKENTMEARPWAGETLKAGKKAAVPKMMVFKDVSASIGPQSQPHPSRAENHVVNPRTGRVERVFADLEAVYPNPNAISKEYSFDELRARQRGWLDIDWGAEKEPLDGECSMQQEPEQPYNPVTEEPPKQNEKIAVFSVQQQSGLDDDVARLTLSDVALQKEGSREGRSGRSQKIKVKEIKLETQTIKTNLDSPTGPKRRRKMSAEPTMTINTRAATDDILSIFNQPLRNLGPLGSHAESDGESDFDDDDYTSACESTGTGRISVPTSEFGDEELSVRSVAVPDISDPKSVSEWSEFTSSKHVPKLADDETTGDVTNCAGPDGLTEKRFEEDVRELVTPVSPKGALYTRYIPIPPEDCEPPTHPYRDPLQVSQNRLPFMTPIVEKTESSIGLPTGRAETDYFAAKTPSRRRGDATPVIPEANGKLLSSPFQEIVNEARVAKAKKLIAREPPSTKPAATSTTIKGPIIKDAQCNPVDDSIRNTILENIQPPLSSFPGFHDHGMDKCNKGPEIRKFIKALTKAKTGADKTTTIATSPILQFPSDRSTTYTIKRELGKGAFAPVYLAKETSTTSKEETISTDDDTNSPPPTLIAIKSELPPSPWEFYIMTTALSRLSHHRASASLLSPHSFHLFADEGYLLEAYHPQGTLLDIVNIAKSTPASTNPAPALDEVIAMFFAVELLRTLEAVHEAGLLHGDLKADNCLVRLNPMPDAEWDAQYDPSGSGGWSEKGVCLIDWGRGIDMRAFRPEVGFIADWKTGRSDCVEMREMRPWTYQVDYWGAAGIIHVLLFGKWIEDVVEKTSVPSEDNVVGLGVEGSGLGDGVVGAAAAQGKKYRLKEGLKRYWATDIWGAVFDSLMNPGHWVAGEEGGKIPLQRRLRGVRREMEEWLVENGERRGLKMGLRKLEERIKERKR